MRVLLDTNALLWQLDLTGDGGLGNSAKLMIENAEEVYISSISLVETQIKSMLGKLNVPPNFRLNIEGAGCQILSFPGEGADCIRDFPTLTRHDPFDRMIIAHAKSESLVLLTSDRTLLGLGLDYVIDATM